MSYSPGILIILCLLRGLALGRGGSARRPPEVRSPVLLSAGLGRFYRRKRNQGKTIMLVGGKTIRNRGGKDYLFRKR